MAVNLDQPQGHRVVLTWVGLLVMGEDAAGMVAVGWHVGLAQGVGAAGGRGQDGRGAWKIH